jgi:hypothetical protein
LPATLTATRAIFSEGLSAKSWLGEIFHKRARIAVDTQQLVSICFST